MDTCRIETKEEVNAYLGNLRYALQNGARIEFQIKRRVDDERDLKYTNEYTITKLFPNENPIEVLRKELLKLKTQDYIKTVKDVRFPQRSEMREFGKTYNGSEEVYIKIRVDLLNGELMGKHTTFVMSFHFAIKPFCEEVFPYRK